MEERTENQLKQKQKSRILGRVIVAVFSGAITQIYLDWEWFFIIIGIYCFIEAVILFSILRRTQLLKAQLENNGKNLTAQEEGQIMGDAVGYAIPLTFLQFVMSLITISAIGAEKTERMNTE